MLIKVYRYLINNYTLIISLTLGTAVITTEMEAASDAQTRDNLLHIEPVSQEDTSGCNEA